VLQTAEQLIEAGCDVFVVADATSSRTTANHEAALERMRADGAQIVTTEMVAFEWLERAGTPEFKEISALIK
jgi:nicotinamidase-related amidase